MNDKELLELAAKAHGKCKYFNDAWRCAETGYREFDPLNDDGDALRLVVKIGLHVGVCLDFPVGDCSYAKTDGDKNFVELHHKSNPESATRRAIVRAAAEIGKTL